MLNLKDREWKSFFIDEIATIESGCDIYESSRIKGKTPYISSTSINNGVVHFIANDNSTREAGCVSVNRNGSVGYAFYHPYDALFSNDCRKLRLNHPSKQVGLFIAHQVAAQRDKYSYAYKMGTGRLKRQSILLPVSKNGTPDWKFMEDYIGEREQMQINACVLHAKKTLAEIDICKNVLPLNEKKWNPFVLSSIFTLETGKGKGLNHLTQTSDGISYLGATNRNNGVLCYVKPEPKLLQHGNGIAFIRNGEGSIGYSVYKAEPFIASSDITIGYSTKLNRYTGLFITTIADTVRGKYNFNYKRSEKRLAKEFLNLPINENGEPDWEYMDKYAKQIVHQKLSLYLQHADNILGSTNANCLGGS